MNIVHSAGMRALPPFDGLIAFDAALRHRSMTRAATELGLTQSAISHRLKKLEGFVGTRLLDRTAAGLLPTAAGVTLAEGLGRLLDALMPQRSEIKGLLALMLLHDARRAGRATARGDIVLLEEQDRSSWDHAQIAEGIALVQQALRADPFAGEVFIFRPRRGDRIKILVYDGTGLCLYAKKLEAGRFCWPSPAEGVVRLTGAQLATLLDQAW